jgi:hypothetical protein
MNKTPWFRPLTVAVLAVALGVVPVLASSDVTVGEFLMEIAKVKNLSARDGESALTALRAAGLRLPALDVRKPLTEADVVAVATAAGLNVTTTRPDSPFSRSQVTSFILSFGSDLGKTPGSPPNEPQGDGPPIPDPQPDKGKSKGFHKSPSEPE